MTEKCPYCEERFQHVDPLADKIMALICEKIGVRREGMEFTTGWNRALGEIERLVSEHRREEWQARQARGRERLRA